MTDCLWEVQKAVYVKLTGDAPLMALITGVYDHVPQNTSFPYVQVSRMAAVDWPTTTTNGWEMNLAIVVLARERGSKTALDILALVKTLLHDVTLTATGCTVISVRFKSSEISMAQDGLTSQATGVFSLFVEE